MIYKLYAQSTTGDGIAQLDIQDDGFIEAFSIGIAPTGLDGPNDFIKVELSFMSSNTFTTNDTRGSIGMHAVTSSYLTSGGIGGQNSHQVTGIEIPVSAGERIYLHALVNAGNSGPINVYVYVNDGSRKDRQRPPRRRR